MTGKDSRLYVYILKPLNEVDETMLYMIFDEIVDQDIEDLKEGMNKIKGLKIQAVFHTIAFPFLLVTAILTKGISGLKSCVSDQASLIKYFFTPMQKLTTDFYKHKKFGREK